MDAHSFAHAHKWKVALRVSCHLVLVEDVGPKLGSDRERLRLWKRANPEFMNKLQANVSHEDLIVCRHCQKQVLLSSVAPKGCQ